MIQKHAIPILEFDDNPQAVLMPTHEGLDLKLPKKCIYAFLEEEIDRYGNGEHPLTLPPSAPCRYGQCHCVVEKDGGYKQYGE